MRFERTDSFKGDYQPLSEEERTKFRDAARSFSDACDAHVDQRRAWPKRLRVKAVEGAKGVFEMTWSFSGPEGRATWQWTTVEIRKSRKVVGRYPAVLWRRVGGHSIFGDP